MQMIQLLLPPNALTLYANLQVSLTCPTAQDSYHAVKFFAFELLQDESAERASTYRLGFVFEGREFSPPAKFILKINGRKNIIIIILQNCKHFTVKIE